MSEYIPFVNTEKDCDIFKKYYNEPHVVRVSLESISKIKRKLPQSAPLWLDPAIDGCEHHLKKADEPLPGYLRQFEKSEIFSNISDIRKPDRQKVKLFVESILDKCNEFKPEWISVPQLPVADNSRNKFNSLLSEATYNWKLQNQFKGKFILPLIFTNQYQLDKKTSWRPQVDRVIKLYENYRADGIWVVDSSLSDQMGTGTFRNRFPKLLELHEYLRQSLKKAVIIAGPYWGLNLILWAKGLCDYPAISLGTAYQYHISGAPFRRRGKSRIAVPPLKRWVVISPDIRDWLATSLKKLDSKDAAFESIASIKSELQVELKKIQFNYDLMDDETNREQVAVFYKKWIDKIDATPKLGRSLTLYQDFSSAFVLGKQLPTLPPSGNYARRPEKVAELFMLNCL